MPSTGYLEEDLHINGTLSARTNVLSDGCVDNDAIIAGQNISADKFERKFSLHYQQAPGSAVVAATVDLHIARASGTVVAIEAAITGTIATGADRTVTIDLLKSTGGAAFASILTAALVLDNTNVLRTLEAGTINTGTFIDGDLLRLTVAVAGAAGNQADGLICTITVRENAL